MLLKNEIADIPPATHKRLLAIKNFLHQKLLNHAGENCTRIKSNEIAELLGCTPTTVRHDFWLIKFGDGVSNGYDIKTLYETLCKIISPQDAIENAPQKCCIVGLGKIGAVFLDDSFFAYSNFCVVAGFDKNVNRTEILNSSFPLYPASRMENIIEAQKISYALLCTEDSEAQKMADRLCKSNVKNIINYTNVFLEVPKDFTVRNCSPSLALREFF